MGSCTLRGHSPAPYHLVALALIGEDGLRKDSQKAGLDADFAVVSCERCEKVLRIPLADIVPRAREAMATMRKEFPHPGTKERLLAMLRHDEAEEVSSARMVKRTREVEGMIKQGLLGETLDGKVFLKLAGWLWSSGVLKVYEDRLDELVRTDDLL